MPPPPAAFGVDEDVEGSAIGCRRAARLRLTGESRNAAWTVGKKGCKGECSGWASDPGPDGQDSGSFLTEAGEERERPVPRRAKS